MPRAPDRGERPRVNQYLGELEALCLVELIYKCIRISTVVGLERDGYTMVVDFGCRETVCDITTPSARTSRHLSFRFVNIMSTVFFFRLDYCLATADGIPS